ncbi:unnamed protein product [Trichogramma brassicae]|uniref:Uncharacterized protein n=1 Tax=Trichogramma brassicae TaxID=86971 RepID=A0A6H5J4X2_9HYME|nr:unnamed protein product [Trichogramma brassicae]
MTPSHDNHEISVIESSTDFPNDPSENVTDFSYSTTVEYIVQKDAKWLTSLKESWSFMFFSMREVVNCRSESHAERSPCMKILLTKKISQISAPDCEKKIFTNKISKFQISRRTLVCVRVYEYRASHVQNKIVSTVHRLLAVVHRRLVELANRIVDTAFVRRRPGSRFPAGTNVGSVYHSVVVTRSAVRVFTRNLYGWFPQTALHTIYKITLDRSRWDYARWHTDLESLPVLSFVGPSALACSLLSSARRALCTASFALTALFAPAFGRYNDVKAFLESGQDPNLVVRATSESPLHLALVHNNRDVAALLLRCGADPNWANEEGSTPLHIICEGEHELMLAVLLFELCGELNQQLQIDAKDYDGNTPLHLTLCKEDISLIQLLLRKGADPNLANKEGMTSLHIICIRTPANYLAEKFFEICGELNQRLEVNAKDKDGNTPLHLALDHFVNKEVAQLLLKHGANPNLTNAEESTPLHIISKSHRDGGLMEQFFEYIVDIKKTVQIDA